MPTLYQQVLGDRFAELHPVLQAFHARPEGGRADCQLLVTHPPGRLKGLLRRLGGVPAAGEHAAALLEVVVQPGVEVWRRTIGDKPMTTRQWRRGLQLMEGVGPAAFRLELTVDRGGLRFDSNGFWFCGVPIARSLSPRVRAVVEPRERSWRVAVALEAPLLGPLLLYEGEVTPR